MPGHTKLIISESGTPKTASPWQSNRNESLGNWARPRWPGWQWPDRLAWLGVIPLRQLLTAGLCYTAISCPLGFLNGAGRLFIRKSPHGATVKCATSDGGCKLHRGEGNFVWPRILCVTRARLALERGGRKNRAGGGGQLLEPNGEALDGAEKPLVSGQAWPWSAGGGL